MTPKERKRRVLLFFWSKKGYSDNVPSFHSKGRAKVRIKDPVFSTVVTSSLSHFLIPLIWAELRDNRTLAWNENATESERERNWDSGLSVEGRLIPVIIVDSLPTSGGLLTRSYPSLCKFNGFLVIDALTTYLRGLSDYSRVITLTERSSRRILHPIDIRRRKRTSVNMSPINDDCSYDVSLKFVVYPWTWVTWESKED